MRAFSLSSGSLQLGLADVPAELVPVVERLGFERAGAVFVRRFPAEAPYAERAAARFELYAESIVRQAAELDPVPWDEALATLVDHAGVDGWSLVGSAARAVRGLEASPHDVDLVADADTCERIGAALADFLVEPLVDGGWLGERWFRAFAHARIECVGGIHQPVATEYVTVSWRGNELQVGIS